MLISNKIYFLQISLKILFSFVVVWSFQLSLNEASDKRSPVTVDERLNSSEGNKTNRVLGR